LARIGDVCLEKFGRFFRPRSLQSILIALVLVALLPVIGAVTIALWRAGDAYRISSSNQLLETVRTLSQAVEGELETRSALLTTYATAAAYANLSEEQGVEQPTDIATHFGGKLVIGVLSPDLKAGAGASLAAQGVPSEVALRAASTGWPAMSNLFERGSGANARPAIAIVAPGPPIGEATMAAALIAAPDEIVRALERHQELSNSLVIAVVDGAGRIIARSIDAEHFTGRKTPDWDVLQAMGADQGVFEAHSAEGPPMIFGFRKLSGTPGWALVMGESLATFDGRWQKPLRTMAYWTTGAILIAFLSAILLARIILRPVTQLARHARMVASEQEAGEVDGFVAPSLRIAEFETLRESLASAEAALRNRAESERNVAAAKAASERRYRALAEVGALVFWRRDLSGAVIEATGWLELTGRPEEEAFVGKWADAVHPDDRASIEAAWDDAKSGGALIEVEFRIMPLSGGSRWVRARGAAVRGAEGAPIEWVGVLEDIDERRQAQARIAHIAHHDALTGLPNRVTFHARLEEAIALAAGGRIGALLYVDLDRFKEVNDTLGHPIGDALLVAVTERLKGLLRENDVVARLGGDEFAIVQSDVLEPTDISALAVRLVETLSEPYEILTHRIAIGASVGIAFISSHEDEPDRILKNADMALYRAKTEGRGAYRFFEPEMEARMQARRRMELELRHAFEAGEFEIHYQPMVNLQTRAIVGFEALLRWRHPQRGLIWPAEFLRLAEEIGLIARIGAWGLNQACSDAMTWPADLKLAVNLSAGQVANRALAPAVVAALARSGLSPHRLELEIVERAMLENSEAAIAALFDLKALGVGITLDNFGAGNSSLGYVRRFPFDKVKIDGSFVQELGRAPGAVAIMRALTMLCGSLGFATTAEGVETELQRDLLDAENCDEAQGFLFSRPCPNAEVPKLLAKLRSPPMVSAPLLSA
jgi:diguanylate cyclase (GGDEF)-like protein/PAS domain S-box-containing protein